MREAVARVPGEEEGMVFCPKLGCEVEAAYAVENIRDDWCRNKEREHECCLPGQQEVDMAQGGRMPDSYRTKHYPDPIKDSIYCPEDDEVHYFKEGDAREVCPGCNKPLDDVLKEAASA